MSLRSATSKAMLICLLLMMYSNPAFASSHNKTDIVYMKNGDKITCEIQSLQKGQLTVNPDYTSSAIAVDWSKVARLESSQLFVITDPDGKTYSGQLTPGIQPSTITIVGRQTHTLSSDAVIEISELGNNLWNKMSGNIAVGTSFTASSSQATLTVQSGLQYQSKKDIATLSSSSQFATQEKAANTSETTVKTAYFHQINESRWYGGGIANFLSSSEQQINLESTLGAAFARRLLFTNRTNLTAIGGIGYTHERFDSDVESNKPKNSIDAATAIQFSMFRFKTTSFDTAVWAYPSLTSPGHFRLTMNQDIYYKFRNDLYVSMSFYDNYDNQPVTGAPANNFGTTTSIGWSFH